MKTEQCFCQSYADDNGELKDCTCGKCKSTESGLEQLRKEAIRAEEWMQGEELLPGELEDAMQRSATECKRVIEWVKGL